MAEDFGFAAPPFDPTAALEQLKRALRDRRLVERSGGFELRGRRLVEAAVDGASISARLAQRPMLTPQWDRFSLRSAADQRRFLDELSRRLARWEHDE